MKKQSLISQYIVVCNSIAEEFAHKYFDKDADPDFWVAGTVGSVILISDYFINMEDMVYCLENKLTKKLFWEWMDYQAEDHKHNTINLRSWHMGLRPTTERVSKEKTPAGKGVWLSDCCNAKANTDGNGITYFFRCTSCNQDCDASFVENSN